MISQLKEYWEGLNERERLLTMIAAAVFAAIFYYAVIWEPLHDSVHQMRKDIRNNQKLYVWMQGAQTKIKTAKRRKATGHNTSTQSLLSLTERLIQQRQLSGVVKEIKQVDDDKVRVIFDGVEFENLMQWLDAMHKKYHSGIEKVDIKRTETAGTVTADVVLTR